MFHDSVNPFRGAQSTSPIPASRGRQNDWSDAGPRMREIRPYRPYPFDSALFYNRLCSGNNNEMSPIRGMEHHIVAVGLGSAAHCLAAEFSCHSPVVV